MTNDTQERATTDGFHLVIDALKLNDIDTIFALPGIPITDFLRKHPELAERIPKKELASYLNLSAETLSRLKQRGKI